MLENNNLIRISNGIRNGNSFSQSRWNWMENSSVKKKLPGVDRDLLFGHKSVSLFVEIENCLFFESPTPCHHSTSVDLDRYGRDFEKKKIMRGIFYVDCSV